MRTLTLCLWAIPYAARWTLSKLGIRIEIPASGIAVNKREEALQQFLAVGLLTVGLCLLSPPVGLAVGGVLGIVKLYNLWRITRNN